MAFGVSGLGSFVFTLISEYIELIAEITYIFPSYDRLIDFYIQGCSTNGENQQEIVLDSLLEQKTIVEKIHSCHILTAAPSQIGKGALILP